MNFKRYRAKSARAGCLLCKPYKAFGNSKKGMRIQKLRYEEIFELEKPLVY